jgi:hypothetical protein
LGLVGMNLRKGRALPRFQTKRWPRCPVGWRGPFFVLTSPRRWHRRARLEARGPEEKRHGPACCTATERALGCPGTGDFRGRIRALSA